MTCTIYVRSSSTPRAFMLTGCDAIFQHNTGSNTPKPLTYTQHAQYIHQTHTCTHDTHNKYTPNTRAHTQSNIYTFKNMNWYKHIKPPRHITTHTLRCSSDTDTFTQHKTKDTLKYIICHLMYHLMYVYLSLSYCVGLPTVATRITTRVGAAVSLWWAWAFRSIATRLVGA